MECRKKKDDYRCHGKKTTKNRWMTGHWFWGRNHSPQNVGVFLTIVFKILGGGFKHFLFKVGLKPPTSGTWFFTECLG